jgi:hypothetical protein
MDQGSAAHNRRSNRSPVLLSAKVEVNGTLVPVILRNLSAEGALVEGATLPAEGSITVFERNALRIDSRVVWVEGRYAGVAFDRKLERDELLREVPKPRQKFEPQYRRPGLACRPLTDADRKLVELWAAPSALRQD